MAVRNQNTSKAVEDAQKQVDFWTARYDTHREKFDKVCRALGIMLDDELLELTVPTKGRLRVGTNYRSHLPVKGKEKITKDLMTRAGTLEEGVPVWKSDRLPKSTDSPYGDQLTRLNDLLIREDFFEDRSELETRLDAELLKMGEKRIFTPLPEMGHLLRYLDGVGHA